MSFSANTISFLLLAGGLAVCGWRLVYAIQKNLMSRSIASGKLIGTVFFLSVTYNIVLAILTSVKIGNPYLLISGYILGHLLITALALASTTLIYYVCWPNKSSKLVLMIIGALSGIGLGLYRIDSNNLQRWITIILLIVSLTSILYVFYRIFKSTQEREIKTVAVIISIINMANILHILVPTIANQADTASSALNIIQVIIGFLGIAVLLPMFRNLKSRTTFITFILLIGFWSGLYLKSNGSPSYIALSVWPDLYYLIAVWGIWCGFKASQRLGGFKNSLGQCISFLTLGVLFQVFGQIIYGYYVNYLNIAIPYPSLADIGWIGSAIFYILGTIYVGKATGINYNYKFLKENFLLILGLILATNTIYWSPLILIHFSFDWHNLLKTILDLAFPILESVYIIIGILSYLVARKLGEVILKNKILIILVALFVQFLSDTNFAYKAAKGTWVDGSYDDIILFTAYFIMVMAINSFENKPTVVQAPI